MFDIYTLKARFYPVVILFIPLVIIGIFYSFEFQSIIHLLSSLGLIGALTYLFSQLGRDRGKSKEVHLWQSWGGAPSVQLLRLKNNFINEHTKQRYHQKLKNLCPVATSPDLNMENSNPNAVDEVYKSWTKFLISQTRDTQRFNLLFKDNVSYGFRRNLWGLKIYAILFIIVLIVGNYIFWVSHLKSWNVMNFSNVFFYSSGALLFFLFFWLFIVTKNWVRLAAFSYAERLCESVENL
jgi:hypothetical protein